MNTACRTAVLAAALSFLLSVTGCSHKEKPLLPQQAQAPVPPPSAMAHYPALPALPPPIPPRVELVNTQEATTPSRPHHVSRRKPASSRTTSSSAETAAEKPAAQPSPSDLASMAPPADASPIGQLTAGGDATNLQQRRDIEQMITNTETGLDKIERGLNSDQQKTAIQIRTFLAKARQALLDNDLDGANTLATKAKVLLDELTKK
ncbi:MAG: hypothetical protein IRZ03_04360 [Acidobacterium ailaaui]|nr:hypothetical protein [Pseudacidobacterium ailaaui]MCL6465022.1 hypothetical protein [Pseudacidobacterium ailaaui]MDI3254338.1 hypothetical protein [Bacillota bacterium]